MDLGWCLMFAQWSHALAGIEMLPWIPSTEFQVEHYMEVSGREVTDIGPWVLFAAARYAAIVVRIMNRWVDRGLLDADQPSTSTRSLQSCARCWRLESANGASAVNQGFRVP